MGAEIHVQGRPRQADRQVRRRQAAAPGVADGELLTPAA